MSPQDALLTWLAARPLWQQDLARRLLAQTELGEDALEEVLRLVIDSISGAPDEGLVPISAEDFPESREDRAPRLVSLGDLQGVAAAASGQSLETVSTVIWNSPLTDR